MLEASLSATLTAESTPTRYALSGGIVALGGSDVVRCWDLESLHSPPLVLAAAEPSPVLALGSMGDGATVLLAAAQEKRLQLWRLRRCAADDTSPVLDAMRHSEATVEFACDHDLASSRFCGCHISSMVFGPGSTTLVLLVEAEAWVFDLRHGAPRLLVRLSDATGGSPLSACALGHLALARESYRPLVLLGASEDRCFKLWHLTDQPEPVVLLQSSLPPGGSVPLCMALHPCAAQFVIGDASGTIHVLAVFRPSTGSHQAIERARLHAHPVNDAVDLLPLHLVLPRLCLGARCTHRIDLPRLARLRAERGEGGAGSTGSVGGARRWGEQPPLAAEVAEGEAESRAIEVHLPLPPTSLSHPPPSPTHLPLPPLLFPLPPPPPVFAHPSPSLRPAVRFTSGRAQRLAACSGVHAPAFHHCR